jgi:hypothetical protein
MTGPAKAKRSSLALAVIAACCAAFALACGPDYYEIPIETPIQPKMDVSPFQRVLVVGFVAGGSEDVDANQETVRLLRSQLRTKSSLKVIDADILPLIDIAKEQSQGTPGNAPDDVTSGHARPDPASDRRRRRGHQGRKRSRAAAAVRAPPTGGSARVPEPADRDRHGCCSEPLDLGFVQRDQETYDSLGRRIVRPVRTYMERKGFILRPKFVFIDGRTGATMYSESYREEILYNAQQNTPALSSYFELMDRLVPNFLNALSSQKIRGTRVLLK